jgi:hypothetical protein
MCSIKLMAETGEAVFYAADVSSLTAADIGQHWANDRAYVRWLMGSRMQDKAALLDECAAALQFPWYFGSNWDAFDECMRQMIVPDFDRIVILIYDAGLVLLRAPNELRTFVELITAAQTVFASPLGQGTPWDHPAMPLQIILQMHAKESLRWERAGARVIWLAS